MLSITDAKYLLQRCKLGKLFEVEEWIASGNSLCVPTDLKVTPLEVGVDTGFHSLVQLLVRAEPSSQLKNRALRRALSHKRLDLIELLVSHGAEVGSVPFIEVLMLWDPTIIRYFLDHGADFIAGYPFAEAFVEKIRTALRPWRECKDKYPDLSPQLQEQADRALRYFCEKEDLKWVSLLMWAGADPRSIGPAWGDEEGLDESEYSSALLHAAYSKNVEILKRLKPDAKKDNLDHLLTSAAAFGRVDVVRYLLELGAKANDKANGGSSSLDRCLLTSLGFRGFRYDSYFGTPTKASKYSVSNTLDTLRLLLEHGAQWRPEGPQEVQWVRHNLLECEPDVTVEIVEQLMKHTACTHDPIHDLLRTPAIKKHLTPVTRKFGLMGFDIRSKEQKLVDERRAEEDHRWTIRQLASRYDREKIYEEIWSEPIQRVAKRYDISDVGLAKVCKKLKIPRPGRGYWAIKAAGKPIPKRPPLPELFT